MLIPSKQAKFIYEFLSGERSIKALEEWMYSNTELETYLGQDDYFAIISLNFEKQSDPYLVATILSRHIQINDYMIWKLVKLMEHIINRSDEVHLHILESYELYCKGYNFLRKLGLDFGLYVASPPPDYMDWESLTHNEQRELIGGFYPEIIEHAERILHCLDKGKIEFTKIDVDSLLEGFPAYPSYVDRRDRKEKRLMSVKVINTDKVHVRLAWKLFRIPIYSYQYD